MPLAQILTPAQARREPPGETEHPSLLAQPGNLVTPPGVTPIWKSIDALGQILPSATHPREARWPVHPLLPGCPWRKFVPTRTHPCVSLTHLLQCLEPRPLGAAVR